VVVALELLLGRKNIEHRETVVRPHIQIVTHCARRVLVDISQEIVGVGVLTNARENAVGRRTLCVETRGHAGKSLMDFKRYGILFAVVA